MHCEMPRKVRRPQAPKPRNWIAKEVRDPQGPYREKSIESKKRFSRKQKHKGKRLDDL